MYPNDARTQWPAALLTDARFSQRWDESKAVGRFFYRHAGVLQPRAGATKLRTDVDTMWDAYLLFDADAAWTEAMPAGLISWGSTIMNTRERLAADLRRADDRLTRRK